MPPLPISRGILGDNERPIDSIAPTLVADSTEIVHAFWATQVDAQTPETGLSLYYARWDGIAWSAPLDIFYTSSGNYHSPQAVIDQDDKIHMVWVSGGFLQYSQALASEAGSTRAWSKPIQVIDERATNASIAVAPNGNIHIAYNTSVLERNISHIVSHIWSSDGEAWSSPIEIGAVRSEINQVVPRLAIDKRNRIHVVFGEAGSGQAVYYLRSRDNGQSWSFPLTIDNLDERYYGTYGPAWINVFAIGRDEVHLVWDGSPSGQRWHQWSDDGGETWKTPVQISPEVRGLTGTNAMGVDSTGRLHLFSMGITGTAPFYASWWSGTWSSLDPITSQGWDGEGPALAVSGDQIVIAWWNHSPVSIEIWSSIGRINAPSILPLPQITSDIRATSTISSAMQPAGPHERTETITTIIEIATDQPAYQEYRSTFANSVNLSEWSMVVGLLPTLGIIILVIVIRRNRKH